MNTLYEDLELLSKDTKQRADNYGKLLRAEPNNSQISIWKAQYYNLRTLQARLKILLSRHRDKTPAQPHVP